MFWKTVLWTHVLEKHVEEWFVGWPLKWNAKAALVGTGQYVRQGLFPSHDVNNLVRTDNYHNVLYWSDIR